MSGEQVPDQRGWSRAWVWLTVPVGARVLVGVAPAVWAVLAEPYAWLGRIWDGAPTGESSVRVSAAMALALVAVAVGVLRPMWAVAVGALAVAVTLAAFDAPWPAVPAASLVLGLGLAAGGVLPPLKQSKGRLALTGLPLAAAGIAGCLATVGTTLGALGLVVIAASAVGAAGRTPAARTAAWPCAVAAGVTFAVAAVRAGDLPWRAAGFAVLVVAAAALALGGALAARRAAEARLLDIAANGAAAAALLFTAGHSVHAAAVCTLWGVCAGLRALWRSERRLVLALVGAGSAVLAWWFRLIAWDVATVEAYTVPAAGIALVAGWLAVRARPERPSWLAYGPGLAAGLFPSLASVLVADDQPLRRLLLGGAAVAVVLAGAVWRLQAPVVLGGVTVVGIALEELVRVWDLLPRWVFLAMGGFALIALAIMYERRRRDVVRLRETVGRMS